MTTPTKNWTLGALGALAALLALALVAGGCGDDNTLPGAGSADSGVAAADTTPSADTLAADSSVDAGPPPLKSQYTRPAFRYALKHSPGMSCASLCAAEKGRCADASSGLSGDYGTCWGRSRYYIPRAWYEVGNSTTSDMFKCSETVPETKKGGLFGTTVHDFVQFECCCLMRRTQWLTNDVDKPKSCAEVCKARGLECGSHDRCWDIPKLCSKSFPKFMVQSMATYSEDAKGKGKLTFPKCNDVPPKTRLLSHKCVCL